MQAADTPEFAPVPSSVMSGIVWPAMPDMKDAATFALLAQLEMSQWWSPEALLAHQLRQATELVRVAARDVPFYRDRLAAFAERPLTITDWRQIPLLRRAEIQDAGEALATRRPLKGHGEGYEVLTSGSTGEPVTVHWNAVASQFHAALLLREHVWQRRDFSAKVAVVRRMSEKRREDIQAGKAARWVSGYPCGRMVFFDLGESVDDALDWLLHEDPDYMMTYPTYLRAMIQRSEARGVKPARLRQVASFGEAVPEELRKLCPDAWGARLVDMYSAQETGIMALECPDHDHYLVQSENVLLEVLDDDGQPCAPGEVGRVVVTTLHNFATPLIRYSIGDYAEVGEPCASGRGLPVIRRFHGRRRNMLTLPSGGKIWVALIGRGLEEIEPLRQFQVVQRADLSVRLKMVVDRPLTPEEEAKARQSMVRAAGHRLNLHLDYVDSIPRSAGGKLEDVISEVVD